MASYNDIFDAYAKLAIEKNIIKNAYENKTKESTQLKKYKSDSYPRVGSDSIKVIENLYNTKPDKPKSQEYINNIMEVAHPEKVIINPAYDKINTLIENNNERQKIIINILKKPVNGQLTQHKYAETQLAKSLVSIANDLDNKDFDDLSSLADECIQDLHKLAFDFKDFEGYFEDAKDIGEGAASGTVLGGIAGGLIGAFGGPVGIVAGATIGSIAGGALAAIFNTAPQAISVSQNAKIAKEELQDIIKKFPTDLLLTSIDKALSTIEQTTTVYADLIDKIHLNVSKDTALKEKAQKIAEMYQEEIVQLDRLIKIFLENVKSGRYADKDASDILSKIKLPFEAIFGDDVQDVVKAFKSLQTATHEALQGIQKAKQEIQSFTAELSQQNSSESAPGSISWFDKYEKELEKYK